MILGADVQVRLGPVPSQEPCIAAFRGGVRQPAQVHMPLLSRVPNVGRLLGRSPPLKTIEVVDSTNSVPRVTREFVNFRVMDSMSIDELTAQWSKNMVKCKKCIGLFFCVCEPSAASFKSGVYKGLSRVALKSLCSQIDARSKTPRGLGSILGMYLWCMVRGQMLIRRKTSVNELLPDVVLFFANSDRLEPVPSTTHGAIVAYLAKCDSSKSPKNRDRFKLAPFLKEFGGLKIRAFIIAVICIFMEIPVTCVDRSSDTEDKHFVKTMTTRGCVTYRTDYVINRPDKWKKMFWTEMYASFPNLRRLDVERVPQSDYERLLESSQSITDLARSDVAKILCEHANKFTLMGHPLFSMCDSIFPTVEDILLCMTNQERKWILDAASKGGPGAVHLQPAVDGLARIHAGDLTRTPIPKQMWKMTHIGPILTQHASKRTGLCQVATGPHGLINYMSGGDFIDHITRCWMSTVGESRDSQLKWRCEHPFFPQPTFDTLTPIGMPRAILVGIIAGCGTVSDFRALAARAECIIGATCAQNQHASIVCPASPMHEFLFSCSSDTTKQLDSENDADQGSALSDLATFFRVLVNYVRDDVVGTRLLAAYFLKTAGSTLFGADAITDMEQFLEMGPIDGSDDCMLHVSEDDIDQFAAAWRESEVAIVSQAGEGVRGLMRVLTGRSLRAAIDEKVESDGVALKDITVEECKKSASRLFGRARDRYKSWVMSTLECDNPARVPGFFENESRWVCDTRLVQASKTRETLLFTEQRAFELCFVIWAQTCAMLASHVSLPSDIIVGSNKGPSDIVEQFLWRTLILEQKTILPVLLKHLSVDVDVICNDAPDGLCEACVQARKRTAQRGNTFFKKNPGLISSFAQPSAPAHLQTPVDVLVPMLPDAAGTDLELLKPTPAVKSATRRRGDERVPKCKREKALEHICSFFFGSEKVRENTIGAKALSDSLSVGFEAIVALVASLRGLFVAPLHTFTRATWDEPLRLFHPATERSPYKAALSYAAKATGPPESTSMSIPENVQNAAGQDAPLRETLEFVHPERAAMFYVMLDSISLSQNTLDLAMLNQTDMVRLMTALSRRTELALPLDHVLIMLRLMFRASLDKRTCDHSAEKNARGAKKAANVQDCEAQLFRALSMVKLTTDDVNPTTRTVRRALRHVLAEMDRVLGDDDDDDDDALADLVSALSLNGSPPPSVGSATAATAVAEAVSSATAPTQSGSTVTKKRKREMKPPVSDDESFTVPVTPGPPLTPQQLLEEFSSLDGPRENEAVECGYSCDQKEDSGVAEGGCVSTQAGESDTVSGTWADEDGNAKRRKVDSGLFCDSMDGWFDM